MYSAHSSYLTNRSKQKQRYIHVVQYLVNAACDSTGIPISKVRPLYRPCGHSIYYNEPMFLWYFFDAGALHLFGPCSELEAFGMGSGSVDGNPRFLISTAVNPDLSGWGTVVSSVSFDSRESLLSLLLSAFLCLSCCQPFLVKKKSAINDHHIQKKK